MFHTYTNDTHMYTHIHTSADMLRQTVMQLYNPCQFPAKNKWQRYVNVSAYVWVRMSVLLGALSAMLYADEIRNTRTDQILTF